MTKRIARGHVVQPPTNVRLLAPDGRRLRTVGRGIAVLVAVTALSIAGCTRSGVASGAQSGPADGPPLGVVTMTMAVVGDPGNASVGVVSVFGGQNQFVQPPANGGIYKNCSQAPPGPPNCIMTGGVPYVYDIGEFEVTVSQYVTFLNTVDPRGANQRDLYTDYMNPAVWPEYGSVGYSPNSADGKHYSVAYPEWANKPFGFANFLRAARFVNSLTNGTVLSRTHFSSGGFTYVSIKVQLSRNAENGMYDLRNSAATRSRSTGFVVPSNDEWIKAAYFDPKTNSYWQYPTGPTKAPNTSKLNPSTGDVVNGTNQPLSTYNPNYPNAPAGTYPTWCPPQAGQQACENVNPVNLPQGLDYQSIYQGNVSTVGQTMTRSPWGTYDQGGNVVEWQDTIVPTPPGYHFLRVWRRMHGGVANAPAYQELISAFGFQPQNQVLLDGAYPWFGFRVGYIGGS